MSAPTSPDRSGRAPLVPPGPSAPAVPTGNSARSLNPQFEFLPDAPMKRPPPDTNARVFVASEHTEEVLAAQARALRHRTPTALSRRVRDLEDGAALALIAMRRGTWMLAAAMRAVAAGIVGTLAGAVAALKRSTLHVFRLAAGGTRAIALAIVAGVTSTAAVLVRCTLHTFRLAAGGTRAIALAIVAGATSTAAALVRSTIHITRTGAPLVALCARYSAHSLGVATRVSWRWSTKILVGATLVCIALGLGMVAIAVGLAGAMRSAVVFLARQAWFGLGALWAGTGIASRAGAANGVRFSRNAQTLLSRMSSETARLRVTVRWHGRSARPIIGAVMAAFAGQIVRTARLTRPQPTRAAMAVAVALIGVAAYASLNREDRQAPSPPPAPAREAPGNPSLASVVPAPSAADTLDALRTIKGRSIELLTPAAETRSTRPGEPVSPVAASASADESLRNSDAMLGSLLVASAPKGANVSVDGIPRGESPVAVRRLRAGNRLVRVELDGYRRWSWAVYVTPSRQTKVNVSLVPENGTSPSSAVTNAAAFAK